MYCCLLYSKPEFGGFFDHVGFVLCRSNVPRLIREEFDGRICANADVELMLQHYPTELAYALAPIGSADLSLGHAAVADPKLSQDR